MRIGLQDERANMGSKGVYRGAGILYIGRGNRYGMLYKKMGVST